MNAPPSCPLCRAEGAIVFGAKNGCTLYRCSLCRLVFAHPIPGNLSEIYGKDYFKKGSMKTQHGYTDYDKDKEPMRRLFEAYIRKAEALVPGRNIFDIGAATGYVLDIAKKRGWKTHGSELSAYAASVAASRGHDMTHGAIDLSGLPPMDVVMMWDVLEHVDDPRACVETVYRMLQPGGVFMLSTPDMGSAWARMLGMRWQLIVPPEHLYYFSPDNLSRLLRECGFDVLEIRKPSKRFAPSYVFMQLAQWQHLALWRALARITDRPLFRWIALPINLRDNMFVVARKRSGL